MKTPPITHAYTTKTVLFLTCKRLYKNDVSGFSRLKRCFKGATEITLICIQNGWIYLTGNNRLYKHRSSINFALRIMQLRHTFDPCLVLRCKRRSKNQIKLQLFLNFSTYQTIIWAYILEFWILCAHKNIFLFIRAKLLLSSICIQ